MRFTLSFTTLGLYYNMGNLDGSIYVNALLFGLFRTGSFLIIAALDAWFDRCGRRLMHTLGLVALAIALVVMSVMQSGLVNLVSSTVEQMRRTTRGASVC